MKLMAKNDDVISFLSNNESLISGKIHDISIQSRNNILCVGLNINLMYSIEHRFLFLEFEVVKEYGFYYSFDSSFYNIERYNSFKSENLFYISFDPVNEELCRDENDNDFILAESVSLYENPHKSTEN